MFLTKYIADAIVLPLFTQATWIPHSGILLAKLIVIPIKNVHYMLEGINIGGEYR